MKKPRNSSPPTSAPPIARGINLGVRRKMDGTLTIKHYSGLNAVYRLVHVKQSAADLDIINKTLRKSHTCIMFGDKLLKKRREVNQLYKLTDERYQSDPSEPNRSKLLEMRDLKLATHKLCDRVLPFRNGTHQMLNMLYTHEMFPSSTLEELKQVYNTPTAGAATGL